MTSEERNELIQKMFEADLELLRRKGHDYSGDEDCISNLREFGFEGVIVRIGDKFHRLKNFIKNKKLRVSDESVLDTLRDLRNYCFLAQILYESKKCEHVFDKDLKCTKCDSKIIPYVGRK